MTLVKVNQPSRPVGNLLDDIFNTPFFGREFQPSLQQPPVNIVETAVGYHLELNAPGRSKEDFKVTQENGLLSISFEEKKENKEADQKVIRKEFRLASFKRSFTLDEKVDAENIQAKYENGLLKLYLPKKAEVKIQPKEITIQ
jgi:HSP20 family protein